MKNIFKLGVAVISAIILYGCATANAAYAPVEDNAVVTTLITETSTITSTTITTTTTTTTTVEISTETTTLEITTTAAASSVIPETTIAANEVIQTTESEVNESIVTTVSQRDYVVYKPSTHYIHKSTCHWVDATCYEIENTENIECRICSECKPDLKVINEYVEPISNVTPSVSEYDYTLLCKIVASEYGGMADTYERAKIVASVMNMVNDSRWPGTVEGVLDQTCAPWGFNKYAEYYCGGSVHYSAMSDAVDYYFNNPDTFAGWTCNQWYGDGVYNYFRTV